MTTRLATVISAIDNANARDPHTVEVDGRSEPAELVYGQRMSATLRRMVPDASEHLQIAARGQHIERWSSPRASYPAGRIGYLQWRKDLKDFHARRLNDLMRAAGYSDSDIQRVGSLVRKERMKVDPEAQALEDVVCVVFLEHYLDDFMRKTEDEKMADILAKTWGKMSEFGQQQALRLDLPAKIPTLLHEGLARLKAKT